MKPETSEKIEKARNKTKSITVKTSLTVAKTTKDLYNKTSQAISTQIEKNKLEKERQHKIDLENYRTLVFEAKKSIDSQFIRQFIDDLGDSSIELEEKTAKKLKQSFPIPVEQTILWTHVIKATNRVGGIVITEKGIFFKTAVTVFEEKSLKKENRKTSELYYYPWGMIDFAEFSSYIYQSAMNVFDENRVSNFLNVCKQYEEKKIKQKIRVSNYYDKNRTIIDGSTLAVGTSMLKGATKFTRDNGYGNNPKGGFGLFAEQANNMADIAHFKNAKVVGGNNLKNGPDRLVNNVQIQTKYYNTAKRSVGAAFNNNGDGQYRYLNDDGSPMKLEVPKGQYEKAVAEMKQKILARKVGAVTDPAEAENIVVEGHYTYEQAVRMSKAGTIDSLLFDLKKGLVSTTCVFGISFLINSYLTYRKTHDLKEAVLSGLIAGGKSGAISLATHVLVSQLSRTKLFARIMTKNVIQSNIVSSAIGFIIFSIPETYNLALRRISLAQYSTNLAVLSASIIGGTVGAAAGAAIGSAAGTAMGFGVGSAPLAIAGGVGGIAGGMVAGSAAGVGTSKIIDIFFEGDDKRISRLFNAISVVLMNEYLLDEKEMDQFTKKMNSVSDKTFKTLFKNIHSSKEQEKTIRDFLEPYFDEIVKSRERFSVDSLVFNV